MAFQPNKNPSAHTINSITHFEIRHGAEENNEVSYPSLCKDKILLFRCQALLCHRSNILPIYADTTMCFVKVEWLCARYVYLVTDACTLSIPAT